MTGPGGRRTAAAVGAALLAAVLALSGCSEHAGNSAGSSAAGGAAAAPAVPQRAEAESSGGGAGSTATPGTVAAGTVAAQPTGRSLIYTGEMQLRTPGVDAAVTRAEQLVGSAGGYVDSEQTGPVGELPLTAYAGDSASSTEGDGTDSSGGDPSLPLQTLPEPTDIGAQGAQLVLRVPAARYTTVFQQLLGLGLVLGQERTSQDVTSQVVDVASRITTQQASVDRVRALMDQAQNLSEVVSLEAALTQRESDLESLEAEQQSLESQTAMSTVTVQIFQAPTAPAANSGHKPGHKPKHVGAAALGALADGWHALYLTFRGLLVALSVVLPFALVLLPLGWLARWLTRRLRHPRPTAAAVPGPSDE